MIKKTGEAICNLLVKSNPFKRKNCNDPKCAICLSDSKINCITRDVMKITVNTTQFVKEHTWETQIRSKSDFVNTMMTTDYVHKNQQCTHILSKSIAGEEVGFNVKVQGVCQGDPMLRQCMEAVLIRDTKPCMNGHEEWGNKRNTSRTIHTKTTTSKEHTTRDVNQSDDIATSIITDVK